MPRLKMLSDVDCLRFSGTNAQILAPKVDIDSTRKLVVLLFLPSRTWPLLRLPVVLSQNLKISVIIIGDIYFEIEVAFSHQFVISMMVY